MLTPAPSAERLLHLLFYVGGVASTIVGSLVSSKIRVYHDNRKSHLDDIKERVLTPLHDGLTEKHSSLVTHQSPVVEEKWGLRRRRVNYCHPPSEKPKPNGQMFLGQGDG